MKASDEFTRLVRGAGRYTADGRPAGALHAAFVRSPHAHAHITAIDRAPARAIDGVVAVLTGAETADLAPFPAVARHPLLPEDCLVAPPRPVLPRDKARYVGEPVALVIAETAAVALDGAEAVTVRYDPLPAVPGPAEAAAPGPLLHADAPGNIAMDAVAGDMAATEADLARAARVVEVTVDLPRVFASPMEPMVAHAVHDPDTGSFDLFLPNQGHPEVQGPLAAVLGLPREAIRVHAVDVGGGFGARLPGYPEHAALLVAARATGRPVSWQASRSETFQTEMQGRGNRLSGRLGLDVGGRFLALAVTFAADLGAFATPVGAHIHAKNAPPCLTGCYRIDRAALRLVQGYSSRVPTGPYRGAGRPDVACLLERLVDEAARQTGHDRIALRRMNLVRPADMPHATPLGGRYDSGDFPRLLDSALSAAGYDAFPARRAEAAARGRLRGIGVGLFVEIAGGGAAPQDEARIALTATGDSLSCRATVTGHASGQGHVRLFSRLLADALGCRAEDVSVEAGSGAEGLTGSGAFGSRASVAMGTALAAAGAAGRAALIAEAAEQFGVRADALTLRDGMVMNGATRLADLAGVVATATQGAGTMTFTGAAPLSDSFPSGCHVAEVEIDPETGTVSLLAYTAVDDCGTVLDPPLAKAQFHGAIAQGIGEALSERVVTGADGQLLTASLLDYALPRADEVPAFALSFAPTPCRGNAFGAKGVGEAGVAGALVAVTNAVLDAFPEGTDRSAVQMPFTPARLWAALGGTA